MIHDRRGVRSRYVKTQSIGARIKRARVKRDETPSRKTARLSARGRNPPGRINLRRDASAINLFLITPGVHDISLGKLVDLISN